MGNPLQEPRYEVGRDVSTWPYAKLARAAEHLARLSSAFQLWLAEQPIGTEAAFSEDRLTWTLKTAIRQPAPTGEWSTIVGDCLHNLRSALDSAIWEFATLDGSPQQPNLVQFPIVSDPKKWDGEAAKRLQNVPEHVIERVRIVQPMLRDAESRAQDALVLLSALSNTDKHRASVSCDLYPVQVSGKFSVNYVDSDATERNLPPDVTLHVPEFKDGQILVEHRAKDPIATMATDFAVQVRFSLETPSGTQDAIAVLEALINYVGSVLSVLHGGTAKEAATG